MKDLTELKETGFGRPDPRHGLRLLWWFAHDCVYSSNGRMMAQCNPMTGTFGFKRFYNRREGYKNNAGRLLPKSNLQYYEVGNLKYQNMLPSYITHMQNTTQQHMSNIDRIIVSYDQNLETFDKIYVTQHSSQKGKKKLFKKEHTYCISPGLIETIKDLELEEFLQTTDNQESDSSSQCEFSIYEDYHPLLQSSESSSESLNRGQPQQQTQKLPQQRPTNTPKQRPTNTTREKSCMDCCCIL